MDVNVITREKAQKKALVIPKETGPKKKRKLMSWRERKAKWLAKARKDELEKNGDKKNGASSNNETNTFDEGGFVLVAKVFEPLDSMLQAFEAILKPNQSLEQVVREYLDFVIEKKRLELCSRLVEITQQLLEK